jgi:EAL domain-containing protein (putative c-di-GMP-specific phosphodiesterase class I)
VTATPPLRSAEVGVLRELGVDYAQGFHLGRPEPLVV